MADLDALSASAAAAKWVSSGALIRTTVSSDADRRALRVDPRVSELYRNIRGEAIFEHDRIPFPSFPYEWAPEMLHAAAMLTLDLALDLLPEALGLKDATPYNVLFRGPHPVFVDILSLERRDPADPTWLPYAQFVRTFLLPLAANRHFGLALDQLLFTRRDGLEPEGVYRWLGPLQRVRPPFLSLVSLRRLPPSYPGPGATIANFTASSSSAITSAWNSTSPITILPKPASPSIRPTDVMAGCILISRTPKAVNARFLETPSTIAAAEP
jgi:hypothetical protein